MIWRTFASLQKEFLQGLGGEEHKGDGAGTEMTFDLPAGLGGKTESIFLVVQSGRKGVLFTPLS